MSKTMRTVTLTIALLSGACGSNKPSSGEDNPEAIPLTAWVDDLIINHTTDQAEPDTVDDKVIADTDDPAAFDQYLNR